MSVLTGELGAKLAPRKSVPEAIYALYEWIEERGMFVDTANGRIGLLYPEADRKAGRTKAQHLGGTDISFAAAGSANMRYWFGKDDPAINNRLCVFA